VSFAQTRNSVPSYLINPIFSNDDCFSSQFSVCQSLDSHHSILARKLFLKLGKCEGVGGGREWLIFWIERHSTFILSLLEDSPPQYDSVEILQSSIGPSVKELWANGPSDPLMTIRHFHTFELLSQYCDFAQTMSSSLAYLSRFKRSKK